MIILDPIFRDALVYAGLLTLISTGLTLTYMTTKVPNFAHGSFATIGVYTTLTLSKVWLVNPYYSLPIAFVIGGVAAYVQYRLILRPLMGRGASLISLMIATVALDLLLLAIYNIYADHLARVYKVTSRYFILKGLDFIFAGQPFIFTATIILVILLVITLHLALTRTKFGTAMRATIENPPLASVIGVNVNLIYGVSWFVAGGLAGVAGALLPLWFQSNPDVGPTMLPSIFAASIAGGFFNIYGAVLGGYLVGITEIVGTSYLALWLGVWIIPYRFIFPLLIMIITLLIAPRGLTGINWLTVLNAIRVRRYGPSD